MGFDLRDGEWLDDNRANWDERVGVHLASDFYDQAPLRAGGGVLDPIAAAGIDRLHPDGLEGVRVLHLQCHFGSDTLSLVNSGATAVGIDFAPAAVAEARRMAAELGVEGRARFIESNVYDARHMLPEPESFDLVFATWGTINWLPDIAEWARIVAWFLKPGGRLYFAEGHPSAMVLDGADGPGGLPTISYAYDNAGQPDVLDDPSDYADPGAKLVNSRNWEWLHPLSTVLGALRDAGLEVEAFDEHYSVPWQIYPATPALGEGMYGWPAEHWLPLSYEIVARNPSAA